MIRDHRLPILDDSRPEGSDASLPAARQPRAARLATFGRCLLLLLLAVGIRLAAPARLDGTGKDRRPLTVDDARLAVPEASRIEAMSSAGLQTVTDDNGQSLGLVAQTLPDSNHVIGYRGPSNVLLLLDEDLSVQRCELLSSADTPEHVAAVRNDAGFFDQFAGWTMGQPDSFRTIDATTGATLTALAIAESVAVRLGGQKPSLRFSEPLSSEDLTLVFDEAADLKLQPLRPGVADVIRRDSGQKVGRLLRTGLWSDAISGYQGPSELLVALNADHVVHRIRLRNTFDNQPYAGYLNEEDYFWQVFLNRKFAALRTLNLEDAEVEGVSGATMTSLAVAETLVAAAEEYHQRQQALARAARRAAVRWTSDDVGTLVVLLVGLVVGLSRLRGWRTLRWIWWTVLVGYFGLVTGNLISLVVFSGWTVNGIAWRLAPGLVAVLAVSLLVPPLTRRNVYCTHLCPHGAVQQILKRLIRSRRRLPTGWHRWLSRLPGLLLLLAALSVVLGWDVNLASWEPFNAWVWYVSGWPSLLLAVVSLLAAAVIPMAWCRYGCATGRLLDYLRHSARAARWQAADGVLVGLTVLIYARLWLQTR